jgi:hypothetical protein
VKKNPIMTIGFWARSRAFGTPAAPNSHRSSLPAEVWSDHDDDEPRRSFDEAKLERLTDLETADLPGHSDSDFLNPVNWAESLP